MKRFGNDLPPNHIQKQLMCIDGTDDMKRFCNTSNILRIYHPLPIISIIASTSLRINKCANQKYLKIIHTMQTLIT